MLPAEISAPTGHDSTSQPLDGETLRSAAGLGYTREWALFCDYTAATNQPGLPTTAVTLARFLTQVPGRASTQRRRIAAIAAAHRNTGHLLHRPPSPLVEATPDPGRLICACPTSGWPGGFTGRRDAYLILLTAVLGFTHSQARAIHPTDLTTTNSGSDGGEGEWVIKGRPVPTTQDPRTCPTCVLVRWLETLGIADGLGRGSARMHLWAAEPLTATSPHTHAITGRKRWRDTAQLLPAIDRHGGLGDYQPLSPRAIHTRLTRATTEAAVNTTTSSTASGGRRVDRPAGQPAHAVNVDKPQRSLDEVLDLLDQVADDADALNARIQALLD